jgi:putative hydrolase of the HAD superfamily
MKLNTITDVFFDLDHTLWDFDKNSALTFGKIFEQHQLDIALDKFLEHYEPINLNYWKMYREERIDKASLRYGRLFDTFQKIGYTSNEDIIHKLSEDYIQHLSSFNHLFEGTVAILEYLQSNYKLHIITNGFAEAQQKKLTNSNIDIYFKTVTNSEMVGVKKPNPKIFEFAINSAQVLPQNSVMIGDNLEADVMGALDFGMDAICFNIHNAQLEAHIKQVRNLMDLKNYL